MNLKSKGILRKLMVNLARGIFVFLLTFTVAGSANAGAQKMPIGSVDPVHSNSATQVDDQTLINGLIKVYFQQYAAMAHLKSLTLLGLTIEEDRAYAVGLVNNGSQTTWIIPPRSDTIGFVLQRIEGSKWSIQPASQSISVEEINLPVPFTAQVPPGDWFNSVNCGQTSVAMVLAYYGFYNHTPPNASDIVAINAWFAKAYNDDRFLGTNGYYTTMERLGYLARNYAHYPNSFADHDPGWTPDRIKQEILAGRPVIVATYLNMDLVKPKMHVMVVRGVRLDASGNVTQVIVNDPGRSLASGRGENFVYDVATFETSWARNDKAIVVITPALSPLEVLGR